MPTATTATAESLTAHLSGEIARHQRRRELAVDRQTRADTTESWLADQAVIDQCDAALAKLAWGAQ